MPKLVAHGLSLEEFGTLKAGEFLRPTPSAGPTKPRPNNQVPPAEHPSIGLGWVSLLRVSWITPLIRKGSAAGAGHLTSEDVWPAPVEMSAEYSSRILREAWEFEVHRASLAGQPPSLLTTLYQAFKPRLLRAGGEISLGGGAHYLHIS